MAEEGGYSTLKDELEQFLEDKILNKLQSASLTDPSSQGIEEGDANKSLVLRTVEEAVQWAVAVKENDGMHVVSTHVTLNDHMMATDRQLNIGTSELQNWCDTTTQEGNCCLLRRFIRHTEQQPNRNKKGCEGK